MPDPTTALDDLAAGALPGILARSRVVITPYPFGVSAADNLRVTVVNALSGVVVNVHGRFVGTSLDSTPFAFTTTPTSDRSAWSQDFVLGAGLVTNLSVFVTGATPIVGQTYVSVQLIRSLGATAFVMGTLLGGYVTASQPIGWPGSPIQSSTDGEPAIRPIQGTLPAAGVELNETVPTGARWELLTWRFVLATNATVTTRQPFVHLFSPGGQLLATLIPAGTFGAGTNAELTWAQNLPAVASNAGIFQQALPQRPILPAGSSFRTNTSNLQAGDQFTENAYLVREWLEAP